ncbi:MAG: hypothetical protein V3V14_05105 [Saprospiraceae bacterium]
MRIYSLTKVLVLPVFVALATAVYFQFVRNMDMGYLILGLVGLLVVMYISLPFVDHWYLKKNPIPLDQPIIDWLQRYSPFYNSLNDVQKEKYHNRMSLYMDIRLFNSVGSEQKNLPADIKGIIASNAIQIGFKSNDYLIGDFDRIFVYKHPFPTPKYQFLHSVETQLEDGVIIYSLEHLIPGMINTDMYYNIGMHGYVEAFLKTNKTLNYPEINASWEQIEAICGLKQKLVKSTLGFETVDLRTVMITCYFTYPDAFGKQLPNIKSQLDLIFKE